MRDVIAISTGVRNRVDLVQHAVDAEAHEADVAPRLDVDVGGALLERVLPEPVDDVDDVLVVGVEVAVLAELDQLLEVARERRARPSTPPAPASSSARGCRTRPGSAGCPAGWRRRTSPRRLSISSSSSAQARTNGSLVATVSVVRSTATGRIR